MRLLILLTLFLVFSSLSQFCYGNENQGFMDVELRRRFSDQWSCFLNHRFKVRDSDPSYFVWHLKTGIRHVPVTWLNLAVDHLHEETRTKENWSRELRTSFQFTPRIRSGQWTIKDRNRFEYGNFESPKDDRWRYRNSLMLSHPLPCLSCSGYVSEECYYDFWAERWPKYRTTIGIKSKTTSWLDMDLYCRWDVIEDSTNYDDWDSVQIIGIKLAVDTDRLTSR